jgi:hypothetical protein
VCGTYESLLGDNRDLLPVLTVIVRGAGEEAPDGHHWENWRDRLQSALSWRSPAVLAGRNRDRALRDDATCEPDRRRALVCRPAAGGLP